MWVRAVSKGGRIVKLKTSDALFSVQMIGMVLFISGQFVRMTDTVQGISPIWLLCAEVFCALNLGLAYYGWRKQPGRATLQLFITHIGWTVGVALLLVLLASKVEELQWGWYDTLTVTLVLVGTMITLVVAHVKGLGIGDPYVRGFLAGLYRGLPHLALAYTIWTWGGEGLSPVTVWAAHCSALVRLGQLAFAIHEAGWDRTRKALIFAETTNETSWILVTITWIIV